jgi:DNA-binding NarL/FixJ family response regulator
MAGDDVRVLLVDDHVMFTQSLGRLLADEPGIVVVGSARNGPEALELVLQLSPDVVLVDYAMPEQDGVAITAEIKAQAPQTQVVMLTGSAEDRTLLAAMEAGVSGFLTKDRAADDVAAAVRAAAAGEVLVTPAMLTRLLPRLTPTVGDGRDDVTERERDVLRAMARGLPVAGMAVDLGMPETTVQRYADSVLAKLDAHSHLEAVAVAVREGVISPPGPRAPT